MAKRGALSDLNSDNWKEQVEDEGGDEPVGTWRTADTDVLAKRKIRKFKRPGSAPSESPAPGGNPFGNVQLAAPAPKANPFAGVQLVPSSDPPKPSPFPSATPSSSAPSSNPFAGVQLAPATQPAKPAAAPSPFGGLSSFANTPAPTPTKKGNPFALLANDDDNAEDGKDEAPKMAPMSVEPANKAPPPFGGSGGSDLEQQRRTLNVEFAQWVKAEWEANPEANWTPAMQDYISHRAKLEQSAPSQASLTPALASKAPATFPTPAATPTPTPAATPAATPTAAAAAASGGDSDELLKMRTKILCYRQERKNQDGEMTSEAGWKEIGTGQLRLLSAKGTAFLEFRLEVSDSKGTEPSDEAQGSMRYGRPVINARLQANTDPAPQGKKSVTVMLISADINGAVTPGKYIIRCDAPEDATKLIAKIQENKPKA